MSAKRETVERFEIERAAHGRAGAARAPSTNQLVPDQMTVGKAALPVMILWSETQMVIRHEALELGRYSTFHLGIISGFRGAGSLNFPKTLADVSIARPRLIFER
jgi:hypothetical protein